jgi:hypothetical protein
MTSSLTNKNNSIDLYIDDEQNDDATSLNRAFFNNDIKNNNSSNGKDVINEFRNVFLENYLEKNKIGRKSKHNTIQKPKISKSIDFSLPIFAQKQFKRQQEHSHNAIINYIKNSNDLNCFADELSFLQSSQQQDIQSQQSDGIPVVINELNDVNDLQLRIKSELVFLFYIY